MHGNCNWEKMIPDKYKIVGTLGSGGFGDVYKVKDEHINKFYALKKQSRNSSVDAIKEIKLLQSLECKGLPALHDAFYDEENVYIVMDLVKGITLDEYVHLKGKLSLDETIKVCCELCDILKYLHGRPVPVIHGDLKPENIMVSDEGVSLIDFGCAFLQYTGEFKYCGTPEYAAPETFKGDISTESDIYSLGKVLFFMLTGRKSCQLHSEKVQGILRGYGVPKSLCGIVKKCLKEEPGFRFRSGLEMDRKLNNIKIKSRSIPGRILSVTAMLIRVIGAVIIVYSIYLQQNGNGAEIFFLAGVFMTAVSFIAETRADIKYKKTILECECNILISDGL